MQDVDEDEDEYAFIVRSGSQPGKIEVFIRGILVEMVVDSGASTNCLLYTSPSPRDQRGSRMPSSA